MNLTGPLPMISCLVHGESSPSVNGLSEILGQEASLRKVRRWPIGDSRLFEPDVARYLSPKRFSELQKKFKGIIYLKWGKLCLIALKKLLEQLTMLVSPFQS